MISDKTPLTPTPASAAEPLHLLLLRALIYMGTVLLFVVPLTTTAGTLAAVAAVPAGIVLGARLAASRLRWPVLGLIVLAIILLGSYADNLLGGPVWVVELLGIPLTLFLCQVLTFGLVTLGVVVGLRILANRVPALAVLEAVAVAAVVVYLFAGHRDMQIDQPRSLADWSFSRGHDPLVVLLAFGLITLGGLALLLLQKQSLRQTLFAAGVLAVLGLMVFLLTPGPKPAGEEPSSPPEKMRTSAENPGKTDGNKDAQGKKTDDKKKDGKSAGAGGKASPSGKPGEKREQGGKGTQPPGGDSSDKSGGKREQKDKGKPKKSGGDIPAGGKDGPKPKEKGKPGKKDKGARPKPSSGDKTGTSGDKPEQKDKGTGQKPPSRDKPVRGTADKPPRDSGKSGAKDKAKGTKPPTHDKQPKDRTKPAPRDGGKPKEKGTQPKPPPRDKEQGGKTDHPPNDGKSGGKQGKQSKNKSTSNEQNPPPHASFAPSQGGGKVFPVAVVTFHDDYEPVEHAYYFRESIYSQFNGRRLIEADMASIDPDVAGRFPKGLLKVQGAAPPDLARVRMQFGFFLAATPNNLLTVVAALPRGPEVPLTVWLPGQGPTPLFKVVPTTVSLIVKHKRPFGLIAPLVLESRKNPEPRRFRLAYAVSSRVLTAPQVIRYYLTSVSLANLRDAGVPAAVLVRLKPLVGQKAASASGADFERRLRSLLSAAEVRRYQAKVLSQCRFWKMLNPYEVLIDCPAGNPTWSPEVWRHYLAYPDNKRYRSLAAEIINKALAPKYRRSPILCVRAFQKWFWENTTYSLSADHTGAADPTASYLFGDRRGQCTHIAHAMTYLLRSQGLPARVAGGYMAPAERRGRGSALLLQNSDGHAWCEMYLRDVGWVVVDATSRRREPPPAPEPSAESQSQWGEMAREDKQADDESPEETARFRRSLLFGCLMIPPGVLAFLYLVKLWRRLAPRFAGAGQLYRLCYRATLDRLADLGLLRRYGETREEFALRLAAWSPEFVAMSAAHVREAVADLPTLDGETWRELEAQVGVRLARRYSWLRRFWGVLNPVGWLWVK